MIVNFFNKSGYIQLTKKSVILFILFLTMISPQPALANSDYILDNSSQTKLKRDSNIGLTSTNTNQQSLTASTAGLTTTRFIASTTATTTTTEYGVPKQSSLLFNEISFKNTTKDWLTIKNFSKNVPINLSGYYIKTDSIIKKFDTTLILNPEESIKLYFKSPDELATDKTFYTKNSGLTGTTEQLILLSKEGNIIDAVCWSNKTPTKGELEDLGNLYQNGGWISKDSNDCVNSDQVKNNQSIIRTQDKDTNSKNDWILSNFSSVYDTKTLSIKDKSITTNSDTTTNEQNNYTTTKDTTSQSSTDKQEIKISTNPTSTAKNAKNSQNSKTNKGSNSPSNKSKSVNNKVAQNTTDKKTNKNTTSKKTKKTSVKSSSVKNGDLSTSIQITEIYPSPDTKLKENEWIEIFNNSSNDINLNNWQIDDDEGGSKPYTLKNKTITAFSYLILDKDETKLNLNNEKDSVRLINYKGEVIDHVEYQQSVKSKSYSKIDLTHELDESISEKISDIKMHNSFSDSDLTTSNFQTNNNRTTNKSQKNNTSPFDTKTSQSSSQQSLSAKNKNGVNINDTDEFYWTTPTKGKKNPSYTITNGIITTAPLFSDTYSFEINNKNGTTKIPFSENVLSAQTAKLLLTSGTLIEVTIDKETKQLITYKTYSTAQTKQKATTDYIIPIILLATFFTSYFLVKNRRSLYIFMRDLKTKHNEKQQT